MHAIPLHYAQNQEFAQLLLDAPGWRSFRQYGRLHACHSIALCPKSRVCPTTSRCSWMEELSSIWKITCMPFHCIMPKIKSLPNYFSMLLDGGAFVNMEDYMHAIPLHYAQNQEFAQ